MAQADAVGRRREADQPVPGDPATAVEIDFLKLLQAQLGNSYRVVVVQEEFDAELPVDADANNATGTGPLAAEGADFDARLTMRDVILVKRGSKVKRRQDPQGPLQHPLRAEDRRAHQIPVDRGWTSVEASVGKRKFRFVNTHLEAFGDPKIREAQAKELTKGPLKTTTQVVLVGDLNSGIAATTSPRSRATTSRSRR